MTDNIRQLLFRLVRYGLTFLGAWLIKHRAVDGTVLGLALDDITTDVVGVLLAVGAFCASWIKDWWTHWKIKVALKMPPESTVADLKVVTKTLPPGTVPTPTEAAAIVEEGKVG